MCRTSPFNPALDHATLDKRQLLLALLILKRNNRQTFFCYPTYSSHSLNSDFSMMASIGKTLQFASLICSLFLLSLMKAEENCDLAINEINTDDVGANEFAEFIELKAVCHRSADALKSLKPFIVVIVKEFDSKLKGPSIVFSADLYRSKFEKDSAYFVIGSPSKQLETVNNLPFNKDTVMYYKKGQVAGQTALLGFFSKTNAPTQLTDVLTNGNDSPMAVILLKDENMNRETNEGAAKLRLTFYDQRQKRTKQVKHLKITDELKLLIKKHLHDILIYSRRSVFNKCGFFEEIVDLPTGVQYDVMLPAREWDRIGHQDLSINRCPNSEQENKRMFLFTRWKIGKRTPGSRNDCTGATYVIEQHLEDILGDVGIDIDNIDQTPVSVPAQCSRSTNVAAMVAANSNSENVVAHRDLAVKHEGFATCSSSSEDLTKKLKEADRLCDKLFDIIKTTKRLATAPFEDESSPPKIQCTDAVAENEITIRPWEDSSHFGNSILDQINRYQSEYVKSSWMTEARKTWLTYLFDSSNPAISKFRCRFCYEYATKHQLSANIPDMAVATGFFVENKNKMKEKIMRHGSHKFHELAVAEMKVGKRQYCYMLLINMKFFF